MYIIKDKDSGTTVAICTRREDGPAIEDADGDKRWYLNDERMSEAEHKRATSKPTCEGKEVEVDGVTYVLKVKGEQQ